MKKPFLKITILSNLLNQSKKMENFNDDLELKIENFSNFSKKMRTQKEQNSLVQKTICEELM